MPTKNTITDLSDVLFEQLGRLNDDDLDEKQLRREIERSKSISSIASNLVGIFRVELDATQLAIDNGYDRGSEIQLLPRQLIAKNDNKDEC